MLDGGENKALAIEWVKREKEPVERFFILLALFRHGVGMGMEMIIVLPSTQNLIP